MRNALKFHLLPDKYAPYLEYQIRGKRFGVSKQIIHDQVTIHKYISGKIPISMHTPNSLPASEKR